MLCSDLERYLEAFLDGRLGRSRTTILRRHLGMCGACRARVERLRRFEREIGRQLGGAPGGGHEQPSLWQGLEIDLVRSFSVGGTELIPLLRPVPPGAPASPRLRPPSARAGQQSRPGVGGKVAGGSGAAVAAGAAAAAGARWTRSGLGRRLSRVAGVVAMALALGAVYEIARAWLVPEDDSRAAAEAADEAYGDFLAGRQDLALRTEDAGSLQNWFRTQLGQAAFPVPPAPEGFRLLGGARAEIARRDAAVIAYVPSDVGQSSLDAALGRPTLLFVQPAATAANATGADRPEGGVAPELVEVGGRTQLAWDDEPYSFRVVSAEPASLLRRFGPAAADGPQEPALAPTP